jgi:hypothetical protein
MSFGRLVEARKKKFDELVQLNKDAMRDYPEVELDTGKVAEWVRRVKDGAEKMKTVRNITEVQSANDGNLSNLVPESATIETAKLLGSETAATIADGLASKLRVISKEEFEQELETVAVELADNLEGTYGQKRVLWVPQTSDRSFLWTSIQVWDHIGDHIDGVVVDTDLEALSNEPGWQEAVLVVVNDLSFSGDQLIDLVDQVDTFAFLGSFLFAVPFIGEAAEEQLERMGKKIRYISMDEPLLTLNDDMEDTIIELEDRGVDDYWWESRFLVSPLSPKQYAVMFSHKLPDRVSAPNFIFALAPFLRFGEKITIDRMTLIKGCKPSDYVYDGGMRDKENDFDQLAGKVCPLPIYKRIPYKMSDRTYAPGTELDVLLAPSRKRSMATDTNTAPYQKARSDAQIRRALVITGGDVHAAARLLISAGHLSF